MAHTTEAEQTIFSVHPSVVPTGGLIIGITVVGILIVLLISSSQQDPNFPLLAPITIGAIVAIVGLVDLIIILSYLTTLFALTTQRVTHRFGIIGTKNEAIELDRIASVELSQGLLGRIFNYGDIRVEGDHLESIINFRLIGSPKERYDQIKHQQLE